MVEQPHDSCAVNDHLSTREVSWVIGESASSVRRMIREGEIEATRVVAGFRVAHDEVLRLARDTVEAKAGRKLTDRELEGLIDEVIDANEASLERNAAAPMRPTRRKRRRSRG